ncbi:MAG: gamma-glutamyltransferase [Rhodobiaceae bacterium]|nr:gamma-glutamyltransferase [Rhodobiaceae bacterium]
MSGGRNSGAGRGAVAAGHRLTVQAAAEVLRDGGNAFDAAIAALWMACVCEPVLASPGGGGFMMARPAGGKSQLFDFFVHTPLAKPAVEDVEFRAIHADFGPATQQFHIGAGAAAAPGFVPGLFAVHAALASRPMARLCEMAVEAAKGGIEVSPFQARLFQIVRPILTGEASARALFAPGGDLLGAGARLRNGGLADAIEAIGREGPRIASEGEIAAAMLAAGGSGSVLRRDDLAGYEVIVRQPLVWESGARRLFLNPPPSCGGALIGNMVARGEAAMRAGGGALPRAADIAAFILECDRAWRASGRDISRFLGAGNAAESGGLASRGTTHVSVIDGAGNAAAATVSNGEGNGHVVPGCGFMLNNMLGEEDINPDGFYAWRPGARLASMMAPSLLVGDDGAVAALGSGGSNRIRTALFQTVMRLLAGEPDLEAAVSAPRIHCERDSIDFEDLLAGEEERQGLLEAAGEVRPWADRNMFFGGVHIACRDGKGGLAAAGDPRRAGEAVVI